jgi:hypothetical protein
MDRHPEGPRDPGLEPTIGDHLRLTDALRMIERADLEELRSVAKLLAQQAFVTHPAAIRYLSREAARNLAESFGRRPDGSALVELLLKGAVGESPGD